MKIKVNNIYTALVSSLLFILVTIFSSVAFSQAPSINYVEGRLKVGAKQLKKDGSNWIKISIITSSNNKRKRFKYCVSNCKKSNSVKTKSPKVRNLKKGDIVRVTFQNNKRKQNIIKVVRLESNEPTSGIRSEIINSKTYYVDSSNGSDRNSGTSPNSAWKSLGKVNRARLAGGDKVLFKRGGYWRGVLNSRSGIPNNPIYYGAYGEGTKPQISHSINLPRERDWTSVGNSVWRTRRSIRQDVGFIAFVNSNKFGFKKFNYNDLREEFDFFYNRNDRKVYIKLNTNPGKTDSRIELALRDTIINFSNSHHVIFENLFIRYGGGHGFAGQNASHVTIKNNEVSYIGGGDLLGNGSLRYGNGIEFWGKNSNHLVENNLVYEIYDASFTNQYGSGDDANQDNITYKNNISWNTGMACLEIWNQSASSSVTNINFVNNTCLTNAYGWGGDIRQRGKHVGGHVALYTNYASWNNVNIQKNLFIESNSWLFFTDEHSHLKDGLNMDDNCWYDSNYNEPAFLFVKAGNTTSYNFSDRNKYLERIGGSDRNSIFANPGISGWGTTNPKQSPNSPCKNFGAKINNSIQPDPIPTTIPTPLSTNTPIVIPSVTNTPSPTNTPRFLSTPTPNPTTIPIITPTIIIPTNTPITVATNTPLPIATSTPVVTNTPLPIATSTPIVSGENTFYMDSFQGNDNNNGKSPNSPWQTIEKLNNSSFPPGSKILFKRGGLWRGSLQAKSGVPGMPTYYGAYGSGDRPVLSNSIGLFNQSDWSNVGNNTWVTNRSFNHDIGIIGFVNTEKFGYKKASRGELQQEYDFYFDPGSSKVYIKLNQNPGSIDSRIELGLRENIIQINNASHIKIENLTLQWGAAHGVSASNSSHVTVRNNIISHIGGGYLFEGSSLRYGNGVEFWGKNSDHLVENNIVFEIYDTSFTNQYSGAGFAPQERITYRNNLSWNTGMACLEIWNQGATGSKVEDVKFNNNTCLYTGYGWAGSLRQRGYYVGGHISLYTNTVPWRNVEIKNNILLESNSTIFYTDFHDQLSNGNFTMDDNCWFDYHPNELAFLFIFPNNASGYSLSGFDSFKNQLSPNVSRSRFTDPEFNDDFASADFGLRPNSACIGKGASSDIKPINF